MVKVGFEIKEDWTPSVVQQSIRRIPKTTSKRASNGFGVGLSGLPDQVICWHGQGYQDCTQRLDNQLVH